MTQPTIDAIAREIMSASSIPKEYSVTPDVWSALYQEMRALRKRLGLPLYMEEMGILVCGVPVVVIQGAE